MKLLNNKIFFLLTLGVIGYAYYTDPPDVIDESVYEKLQSQIPDESVFEVKSNNPDAKFMEKPVESLVDKINKTETGHALLTALAKHEQQKKYAGQSISAVDAQEKGKLLILDRVVGEGDIARCGSVVDVSYKALNNMGVEFDSTKDETIAFKIGGKQVIPGLEMAVYGMRNNGVRRAAIPSHLAYDLFNFNNDMVPEGSAVVYDIKLMKVKDGNAGEMITVTAEEKFAGVGVYGLACSNEIKVKYRRVIAGDEQAYKERRFNLANAELPLAFERGMIGMKLNSVRVLHIPNGLLSKGDEVTLGFDLSDVGESEDVVVEVELVGVL